ncbi:unnamed protein product [Acanthosepion pharaonis]|uniref:ATP-dependent DNA helicase n=1 Tax=Acanthosepion pharaonis TaxID=158019 RepID=A0A812BFB1_ACAPH|nr:unnamed protein product [Sepia pharaonis]
MIHGPCGSHYNYSSCHNSDGKCTRQYPRDFVSETITGSDSYPLYRRRSPAEGGFTAVVKGHQVDNRWVVPYCPLLTKAFNARINVEYCHSVRSIKYVCKYINKGTDAAMFGIRQEGSVDEIQDFHAGRVIISSTEGPWHIFSFPIYERFPAIVIFLRIQQWMWLRDEFSKTLLYTDVPSYYVWTKKNTWARRKCGANVEGYPGVKKDATLGRVFTVPPSRQECFYLRLILHEVSGPTSYNNLRTVNGVLCDTFRKACLRLGLLEDDSQWDATMAEGALLKMPSALRHLLTTILQVCEPSDPKSLWDKYKDFLSEDILREAQLLCPTMALTFNDEIYNRALIIIENLPKGRLRCGPCIHQAGYRINGGTGKTFETKLLLAEIRRHGEVALTVASSGIAAILLPGGRTVHSTFKLPLDLIKTETAVCGIAKLIVWDERTVSPKTALEAVNRSL